MVYHFDIRPAIDQPERLGLDFDVAYETSKDNATDPRGVHYALRLNAKGFQTFADAPDVNSMIGEVSLLGHYYRQRADTLAWAPELVARYLELSDLGPEELTAGQIGELGRFQRRVLGKRSLFTFDVHYRYEADHDVTTDDHVFGAGVVGEVPGIHELLDVIPALTRERDQTTNALLRPRPVRFFVGLDRVTGAGETTIGKLSGNSSTWRGRAELAWGTRVLQGFAVKATFEAHYFFDANQAMKQADRELDTFFQAWLLYPLSDKTNILVKYIDGRLPPDYDAAKSGKVGLSISLQ